MKLQKKILGNLLNRNMVRHLVKDRAFHLLDNLYILLMEYYASKTAEKVVKNILKLSLKIGLHSRENKFNEGQKIILKDIERKFRETTLTIVSFQVIFYSYDKEFLLSQFSDLKSTILSVVRGVFSEKSEERLEHVFWHLTHPGMLDSLFCNQKANNKSLPLETITEDLQILLEIGNDSYI